MPKQEADPAKDLQEVQLGLGEALVELEQELCLGLALREDRLFRLNVLGGAPVLLINLPLQAGWIRVTPDGCLLSREQPSEREGTPSRAVGQLLADTLTAEAGQRTTFEALTETAKQLVVSLFEDDRQGYIQLAKWAPLVEASVYVVSMRLAHMLDAMRRSVRDACVGSEPDAAMLASAYRRLANALARATLLSTDAGSSWLSGLSESRTWERWTPSFALTRERDRWGVLIGARAASRFGPAVIEPYLSALGRARHPLIAFDALVGLSAIGLAHPSERGALIKSLDQELAKLPTRDMLRPDLVANGHAEVRRLLCEQVPRQFALFESLEDSFNLSPAGRVPIFELIPGALEAAAWKFIPGPDEARPIAPHVAKSMFVRAWVGAELDLSSLPPSAFRRA